jgi:hypothetical protein
LRGTATDPSGSAVPKAAISLVSIETNFTRNTVTDERGDFELPDLRRGTYRLTVTAAGFRPNITENIILEAGQIRRVDVALEVGAVGTEITVRADAAVISTESAKIQGGFSNQRFADAPWFADGRNPQTILSTLPLIQSTGSNYGLQFAGQSTAQVQTGMDGHTNNGAGGQVISVHDIAEVNSVPVNNSAEFARVGYFNMTTKAGTNRFHGRAFYWHQNSAFGARSFFDAVKVKNKVHIMHGALSGPIRRDKTFFYASWTGERFPGSSYYLRDVPTQKMRQGDFSQLLGRSSPITLRDPLAGAPFPGNIIPSNRQNATSLKVQEQYIPAPNLGSAETLASNYGFLFGYPIDAWHWDYFAQRVDHKISEKNTIYGTMRWNWISYLLASGPYPKLAHTRLSYNNELVIEDTHIFSPSLVHTFRFGLYKYNFKDGETVDGFTPIRGDQAVQELGLQGVNRKGLSAMGFPRMDIAGYSTLLMRTGGKPNPLDKTWGYADSLTWSKGRHVFKLGGEYKPQSQLSGAVPEGNYGSFNFNGSFTGYGQADFLLGMPFSSQRLDPLTNRTLLDSELGIYVQDYFKATSRLTLEMGLRWDRFGAANYDDGLIYNWDPTTGNVIVPEAALQSISPLYPTNTIKVTTGKADQSPSLRNFNPRIGAAYRPFGNRSVIRGGYGIFTETLGRFVRAQGVGPYQISETFFNSVRDGQPLFAFPNPFPPGSGSIPSQSVSGFPEETKNGRIHQFNVTLEQQVKDIGFRLSYVGSRSRGLNYNIELNKPQPSLIPFSAGRRPYPQFVGAAFARTNGAANYNSLTFQALRKVGGLTFDTHWSWASNYTNMLNLENPYSPLLWNRDGFTSRHRVVLNVAWELPVGRGRTLLPNAPAAVNHIIGGWQVYWIAYMETGQFFTPSFSGADPSNTNTSGGLPDRIADGNLPAGERRVERWFDAAAFVRPPQGRFGNSGVNILEGPGFHEHRVTLSKRFKLSERFDMAFQAAIQNLFNHANFNNPRANIAAPATVGTINSIKEVGPARLMVMRLRLDF